MALHDHPDAAAPHFREVIKAAPQSRLAALSASWLKIIQAYSTSEEKEIVTQTMDWLMAELLVRDKKVEELTRQLKALKEIGLEMEEKTYRMKPRMKTSADSTN